MKGAASFPVFSIPSKSNRAGSIPSHVSVGVMECAEMGNVSAAINTAFAICRHEPKLIIFSGIAGSLDSATFRIGDVVFPRRVQTRYFQKFKTFSEKYADIHAADRFELIESVNGRLITNPDSIDVLYGGRTLLSHIVKKDLEREIEDIPIPEEWHTEYGVSNTRTKFVLAEETFCWEHVLSNKEYVKFLKGKIAGAWTTVDMESYGFLRAVAKLRESGFAVDGIVVRSVSDFAEFKELSDSDRKWRDLGLRNMAIATRYVIESVFHKVF